MKFTKCNALIPKGTYVPSNLSDGQRLKQAISNNPDTMASKGNALTSLGFAKDVRPASPKSTARTNA